jgi:type IX secretion system substrate protein/PKD domain-containing protein/beta-propeller repeat-containing protein
LKKIILIFALVLLNLTALSAQGTPSLFIKNNGQWDSKVQFSAKFKSYNLWITDNGIIFDIHQISVDMADNVKHRAHAFKYEFINSSRFTFQTEEQSGSVNYFTGKDRSKWVSNAPAFRSILIKDIYPGIDLKLYTYFGDMRYDFIVNPSADPNKIQLKVSGADSRLQGDNLVIDTEIAEIINSDIYSYTISNESKEKVESRIELKDGIVRFSVENYDKSKQLTIDPLVTSRIFGGNDYDYGEALATDLNNNTYVAGYTYSFDFPTSLGAYDPSFKTANPPKPDCFITKFSANDDEIVYSTFLGSFKDDYCKGIRVDNLGRAYITGYTGQSESFPVTEDAYQKDNNGGFDIFVTRLSAAGDSLEYSTLLGGTKDDYSNAIAIDNFGYAYVTGFTVNGGDFPVTDGSVSPSEKGKNEAFVTKINRDGSALVFSTYLGGSENDFGQAIDVDILENVYVTGITRSLDFPVSDDAYDKDYNDPDSNEEYSDCFLTKINPTGNAILYSTYFGGDSKDAAYGLDVDPKYNVYLTGYTQSKDFPVTPDCYDPTYNSNDDLGIGDAFITKFKFDFSELAYSTYIGGKSTERAFSIKADKNSNAHITGSTNSDDFPSTSNGFDREFSDTTNNSDAFYLKLDSAGKKLHYATYLGGRESDIGKKIEVLPLGSAIIVGTTFSKDFPNTNEFEEILRSNAFISKIYPFTDLSVDAGEDKTICRGDSVLIGNTATGGLGELTYKWIPSYGLNADNIPQPWAKPDSTVQYTIRVSDEFGNMAEDYLSVKVINIKDIEISGATAIEENTISVYTIVPIDDASYTWTVNKGEILSGQGTNQVTIKWSEQGSGYVDLYVDTFEGCADYVQRLEVIVGEDRNVRITALTPLEICASGSCILDVGAGYQAYHWSNDVITRYDTVRFAGKIWCVVIDQDGISRMSDTVETSIKSSPKPPFIRYYEGFLQCLELAPSYQWYRNDAPISGATSIKYWPTINGIYKVEIGWTFNDCTVFSDTIQLLHLSVPERIEPKLDINPNPNSGEFSINISSLAGSRVELGIKNILGKSIYKNQLYVDSNVYKKEISLATLPKGIYFIEIRFNNRRLVKKMIVK